MKSRCASLVLVLCLTTPFLAQSTPIQLAPPSVALVADDTKKDEAKIVLVAPSTARIGELVRLSVAESTADSFKWLLVPGSVTDFLTYDAGARAVFSGRVAGEYRFIVACAKGGSIDVVTHTIRIIGPPSEPTSGSLVEWIPFWNWTMSLPKEECNQMATSFEAIATRVDELIVPADWINATAAANRKVLGDRLEAWKPMLDKIGEELLKRAENGGLSTPEEHARMWKEIAAGLRAA